MVEAVSAHYHFACSIPEIRVFHNALWLLSKIKEKKHIIFLNKTDLKIEIESEIYQELNVVEGNTRTDNGLNALKIK